MRTFVLLTCVGAWWVSATLAATQHHEGDIIVGWTDDDGAEAPIAPTLAAEFEFDVVQDLPPVDSFIHGWSDNEPGFDVLDADEPDEHFYMLQAGVQVYFEVIALTPGLRLYQPGFAGELCVGDQFLLGGADAHEHPIWHIDSTMPGVDPTLNHYDVTFRLLDQGTTGYQPSAAYTLLFVPEPTALLGVLWPLVLRRR